MCLIRLFINISQKHIREGCDALIIKKCVVARSDSDVAISDVSVCELVAYLPLLSRGGSWFFFLIKRTKNQVTTLCFVCRTCPALQSRAAPRAVYLLPHFVPTVPMLQQNLKGPFPVTQAISATRLSPRSWEVTSTIY
ncbi:hypothetical protein QE417_000971 [Mucilaginibacter terrae]|uniref:Uncharacterized protein n=1 Tax=Mucilaginibacter terrae TaxID=1955052 RepID=A0ABU3GQ36_9SPHI|nr:hypothetical protein [Mucilaginibacter terrae]